MKHPDTIVEKTIVLALHTTKAYWIIPKQKVNIGIIGAALLDMCELKEIEINNKLVSSKVEKSFLSVGHNYLLEQINKKPKMRKVKRWLLSLNRFPSRYRWHFFDMMVKKGMLSIESKVFIFIPYKRIGLTNALIKSELVKDIHKLIKAERINQQDASLLSMILALKLFKPFGSGYKERIEFKRLLKKKVESNPISSGVDEAIREMQAAVMAATIAASAGATAVSGGR